MRTGPPPQLTAPPTAPAPPTVDTDAPTAAHVVGEAPDGMLAFDRACRYTLWNAAMERISGVGATEVVGRRAFELFPFLADTGEDLCFHEALAGRTISSSDRPFTIPETGHAGFYEARYAPLRDATGAVVGGVGIVRDVTARVRAARETAEARARAERALRLHALVLERMTEGVSVTDEHGVIVYTNPAEDRMFGYAPGELVGRHVTVQNRYPPEENARVVGEVIAQLRERGYWEGEWENVRKDGTPFLTHARITALDRDGAPYWVCVQEDVTERRLAVRRQDFLDGASVLLGASVTEERTLAALVRHCVPTLADYASVDLLGADGEIRRVETAHVDRAKERVVRELWARYPYQASDVVGVPLVIRTGEPQALVDVPDALLARFARDEAHLALLRELGPCSYVAVPLVARGRAYGALSLVRTDASHGGSGLRFTEADVELATELGRRVAGVVDNARAYAAERAARADAEEARARAEEANRAKSQFLATMSHELRTPLNAIAGHVQLLALGIHGPLGEAQREALTRVDRAQHHLLGLINDVLNYARIESGRVEYDLQPVRAADVVRDVATMVEPQLQAKGLLFDVRLPDEAAGALLVRADREKLLQILLNLLSNAVKFTPAGGRVAVEAAAGDAPGEPDVVLVHVVDTGIGIPSDKLEAVFEPFVQVRSDFARGAGGTGLCLAIIRDLARGMGGDLRARSVEGAGSTFTVTLRRSEGR